MGLISIVFNLLEYAVRLLTWALFLSAIVSTLLSLNVLDRRNQFVWSIADFLYRVTDPLIRPVRRWMPNTGALDLSFIVVLIGLQMVVAPLLEATRLSILTGSIQPLVW